MTMTSNFKMSSARFEKKSRNKFPQILEQRIDMIKVTEEEPLRKISWEKSLPNHLNSTRNLRILESIAKHRKQWRKIIDGIYTHLSQSNN